MFLGSPRLAWRSFSRVFHVRADGALQVPKRVYDWKTRSQVFEVLPTYTFLDITAE